MNQTRTFQNGKNDLVTGPCQPVSHKKGLKDAWAMQADLNTLVGGQEWANRQWSSDTLAYYNRREFASWLAANKATP